MAAWKKFFGLDMDYLGRPFGPMPALLATAPAGVHSIASRRATTCAR